jgi:hypothetical protein
LADTTPLTLQDIQDRLEVLTNNDSDTPATTDDEWTVRLSLINQAIDVWAFQDVIWDELWTTYTHGATISAATTYTPTFTDFRFPAGKAKFALSGAINYVRIVSPEEAQNFVDTSIKVMYLTGNNNAGWTIHLNWTPASGDGYYGATLSFDYYHYPFKLSGTTDKPEMSIPQFIVFWVAAQKALQESQNNKFSIFDANATAQLETMKIMAAIDPVNQGQTNDDLDAINDGAIIGQ